MRVAIFSDIHGNQYSFREIMRSISAKGVDLKIFCGDICGYYYGHNEIIEALMKEKDLLIVRGNHDDLFVNVLSDPALRSECVSRYGTAYDVTHESMPAEYVEYIGGLPESIEVPELDMFICHGSPWDQLEEYIYPDSDLARFAELKYKYVVLGHTHYPMFSDAGSVKVLNPGSCGQPRDFNVPSYMILDTDSGEYTLERCSYDQDPLKKEIEMRGETNPYVMDILNRSRK